MEGLEYGVCRHCGQVNINIETESLTKEEADKLASKQCGCPGATRERGKAEQKDNAGERVRQLFGEGAPDLEFVSADERDVELLLHIVDLLAEDALQAATVQISASCRAKLALTAKGKIKVERAENFKYQLEE